MVLLDGHHGTPTKGKLQADKAKDKHNEAAGRMRQQTMLASSSAKSPISKASSPKRAVLDTGRNVLPLVSPKASLATKMRAMIKRRSSHWCKLCSCWRRRSDRVMMRTSSASETRKPDWLQRGRLKSRPSQSSTGSPTLRKKSSAKSTLSSTAKSRQRQPKTSARQHSSRRKRQAKPPRQRMKNRQMRNVKEVAARGEKGATNQDDKSTTDDIELIKSQTLAPEAVAALARLELQIARPRPEHAAAAKISGKAVRSAPRTYAG